MVGTACWRRLDDRQRPNPLCATAARAPNTVAAQVFGVIVDVAVECHRVGDAQQRGVVDQPLLPPAAAQDVQMHVRNPRAQFGDRRRARPRSACAAPAATAPRPAASPTAARSAWPRAPRRGRCAPRRCGSGPPRGRSRSRADGSDTVTYWLRRCSRGDSLDSTNQPILPSTGPATGHCSRWQWCTSTATRRPKASRARNGSRSGCR